MGEPNIIGTVTAATGLPNELVQDELKMLITAAGLKEDEITLDDLREILAAYLQDVLSKAKEEFATR